MKKIIVLLLMAFFAVTGPERKKRKMQFQGFLNF